MVCDVADVSAVLLGVRQLKLDPEAVAEALRLDPAALPRLHEGHERCVHRLDDGYRTATLPLKRIYVLDWGRRSRFGRCRRGRRSWS